MNRRNVILTTFFIALLGIVLGFLVSCQQIFAVLLFFSICVVTVVFQKYPLLFVIAILCIWVTCQVFLLNLDFGVKIAGYPLSMSRIIGIMLVFEGLLWMLRKENIAFFLESSKVIKIYFLFCVYTLYVVLTSSQVQQGLVDFVRLLSGFFVLIIVAKGFSERQDKITPCLDAILGFAVLGALFTIAPYLSTKFGWNFFGNFTKITLGTVRSLGVLGSAGGTSGLFQVLTGIALYQYSTSNRKKYLFFILMYGIAIFATSSRSGVMGIMIIFALYAIIELRRKSIGKALAFILLLFLIIGIGVSLLGTAVVAVRLSDVPFIGTSLSDESMGLNRLLLWKASIASYKEFPLSKKLFGAGFSYVHFPGSLMLAPTFSKILEELGPHNDFLDILLKLGACGLAIYFLWILYAVRICFIQETRGAGLHNNYLNPICCITFISYIISQQMIAVTFYHPGHRWFMLLLLGLVASQTEISNFRTKEYASPLTDSRMLPKGV